jgi:hypothetical protein
MGKDFLPPGLSWAEIFSQPSSPLSFLSFFFPWPIPLYFSMAHTITGPTLFFFLSVCSPLQPLLPFLAAAHRVTHQPSYRSTPTQVAQGINPGNKPEW